MQYSFQIVSLTMFSEYCDISDQITGVSEVMISYVHQINASCRFFTNNTVVVHKAHNL